MRKQTVFINVEFLVYPVSSMSTECIGETLDNKLITIVEHAYNHVKKELNFLLMIKTNNYSFYSWPSTVN